jgi:hypothetical protein
MTYIRSLLHAAPLSIYLKFMIVCILCSNYHFGTLIVAVVIHNMLTALVGCFYVQPLLRVIAGE